VVNQDTVVWVGQGAIADREHLGRSDVGVAMLRPRLEQDLEAVMDERDPEGLIRDVGSAEVTWPFAPWQARLEEDFSADDLRQLRVRFGLSEDDYFVFYAGHWQMFASSTGPRWGSCSTGRAMSPAG
jgi:hypothetical protein